MPNEPEEEAPEPITINQYLLNIFAYYGYDVPSISPLTDTQSQLLIDFISQQEENTVLVNLAFWGFNEISNENISWDEFKNGFLTDYTDIQLDTDPDIEFNNTWHTNSLYFSYQNLPSLINFKNNYPKNESGNYEMSSGSVYFVVGGDILQMKVNAEKQGKGHFYRNACALRVSYALLKSGIIIPNIPNVTFKGADMNGNEVFYFLRAEDLYTWMMKEFYYGTRTDLTNVNRGNTNGDGFTSALLGKQGIYLMIPQNKNAFGATGHAGIYTHPPLTNYYFGAEIKNIALWQLN